MTGDVVNFKDFQVPPAGAILDYNFFNLRFLIMCAAFNGLAARQDGYDVTMNTLVQTGLNRINLVLGPLLTELQEAAQSGFLIANANGPTVSLVNDTDIQFTISSSGMSLFTPTPWLLAADQTDSTNWGILSFTSYNSVNGVLAGHCVYASKTKTSTQWSLSCSAGVIPAMTELLADTQSARDAAAATEVTIAGQLSSLTGLIAAVNSGPVAEVCGYTGIVTLSAADITGLVATLNTLATAAALNSGLSTKQASSALLTAFAALQFATDKLTYSTGPGTFSLTAFTAMARTLLACVDAPSMCTSLGAATMVGQFDDQSGTSYQFTVADSGKMITLTNSAAIAASLPNNLPKGWNALIYQGGTGAVTFGALSGATLHNRQNQFKTAGAYAVVSLLCVSNSDGASAVYVLGGDTSP
jgi:hypothetical protein